MKKAFALILAIALVLGMVPAGVALAESAGKASFHWGFLDEPPGIDPGISQGGTQSTIYAALFEGLVTSDEAGNVVPAAAESWDVSDDKTQYTFHLRAGLKWSDGQPLTAKDFEYAWLRVLTPATASTYSWFVEMFLKNGSAFAMGFVTNGLNPKATLFFLSLFTVVIDHDTPLLVQAGYGAYLAIATICWFLLVAWLFSRARVRAGFARMGHWFDRLTGAVLIGLGARLALSEIG